MKAIVSKDLVKIFGVTSPLSMGQEIEVEHLDRGHLYKITAPLELADTTIHKDYIDLVRSR